MPTQQTTQQYVPNVTPSTYDVNKPMESEMKKLLASKKSQIIKTPEREIVYVTSPQIQPQVVMQPQKRKRLNKMWRITHKPFMTDVFMGEDPFNTKNYR